VFPTVNENIKTEAMILAGAVGSKNEY